MVEYNSEEDEVIDSEEHIDETGEEQEMEYSDRSDNDEMEDPYDDFPDAFEEIEDRDIE